MGETPVSDQKALRRVAVIAVHGVGEHAPGEVSAALARQLLSARGSRYSCSQSVSLDLDVDAEGLNIPVGTGGGGTKALDRARLLGGLGSGFLRREKGFGARLKAKPLDQRFTSALLMDGQDYQATYATVRRSLELEAPGGNIGVDIHELHWSDLSHGGLEKSYRLFSQFMQLLLHVASLGRTTLASALDGAGGDSLWRWLYRLSAAGYWLLAMPVLMGNLLFVLLACLLAPGMLLPLPLKITLAATAGLGASLAAAWFLLRCLGSFFCAARGWPKSLLVPASLLPGGLAAAAVWLRWDALEPKAVALATIIEALLLAALATRLMHGYDRLRPGALLFWCVLGGAAAVVSVPFAVMAETVPHCLARIGEFVYAFLLAAWCLLLLANALLVLGVGVASLRRGTTREQAAAANTALLAASLPAPLMLSVVLTLWTIATSSFEKLLPKEGYASLLFPRVTDIKSLIAAMIAESATVAFTGYLALLAVAGVFALWGFLPSVAAEVLRPAFAARGENGGRARLLGCWLDGAYAFLPASGFLAGFGFFVLLPAAVIAQNLLPHQAQLKLDPFFGQAAGGVAVALLAATQQFAGNFSHFLGRLRVVIDTALDVDNWLRERPRGDTPRLRIFARFGSLLREVQKQGYDRLVIVAHSQGTIVTTDFLRYLRFQAPELLDKPAAIHLVTMGCPLRQLYAWRFPFLYGWVRGPGGSAGGGAGPAAADCGVARWVNIYGSGDYVGRWLWKGCDDPARWEASWPEAGSTSPQTLDVCLGAQAHTHYFDADNELVAKWINAMIV